MLKVVINDKMKFHCRGNCGKLFASLSSRNKHERKKKHFEAKKSNSEINVDEKNGLFLYCETS